MTTDVVSPEDEVVVKRWKYRNVRVHVGESADVRITLTHGSTERVLGTFFIGAGEALVMAAALRIVAKRLDESDAYLQSLNR